MAKIKAPRKSWADRRLASGPSYTRNAVSVRRVIEDASVKATGLSYNDLCNQMLEKSLKNGAKMESSNDKFLVETGLFANKGEKDGRCNRTACQARIGNHPELPKPAQQWVMRFPFTAGDELFYCSDCARLFLADDRRSGRDPRVSLY